MSDLYGNDCEGPYLVKRVEGSSRMKFFIGLLFFGLLGAAVTIPAVILTQWKARDAADTLPLRTPVPYVVIHHSSTPAACHSRQECVQAMQSMQNYHIDGNRWWDIGYNFGVGSDGVVYEGRGWPVLGAHALHFNTVSIGICVIGDWTDAVPPAKQLKAVKSLIEAGVRLGHIKPEYKVVGHRQVRDTECPGQALYKEIQAWDHWVSFPASHEDLANVPELKTE